MVYDYNDLKLFDDGVKDKVKKCKTLDERSMCWVKKYFDPSLAPGNGKKKEFDY